MRKVALLSMLTAGLALIFADTTLATIIRNTASNQNLFKETYELPVGLFQIPAGGAPGTWNPNGLRTDTNPNWPNHDAFSGVQYGRAEGTGANNGDATFAKQTSGTVRLTTMVLVDASNPGGFLEVRDESGANRAFWINLNPGGNIEVNDPGNSATGFSLGTDTWHELVIDYSPGATQMSISLDGLAPEIHAANSIADVGRVVLGPGGARFFVDDVPEPGTLSLLTLGGLMMLKRRRRA